MPAPKQTKPLLLLIVAVACLLAFATTALGQCSMCRSALAGSGNAFFIRNFNIGVLVLLVPPVTIFCTIFVALKRYKTVDDESVGQAEFGVLDKHDSDSTRS